MAVETKGVLEDMLNFYNSEEGVSVNHTPLADLPSIPRVGEYLGLPGTAGDGGDYQVVDVRYSFNSDEINGDEVRLLSVTAHVKRIR